MTSPVNQAPSQPKRSRWLILCLGLLITVLVHAPVMGSLDLKIDGRIFDSDGFTRLQRVIELNTQGRWYDGQTQRTNAPYGETVHWTRPLDTILFVGAWIGSSVTDFRNALEIWGQFLSPVLLLLMVVVWRRGTRGVLNDSGFLFSLALLPLLLMFDFAFFIGRPDHHSLLNLLFIASLVLMFRIVAESANSRLAFVVGILSGAALWISVEALVTTSFFATALALLWLWRGPPYLVRVTFFMVGLFAAISVAILIERPPSGWSTPVYQTISVVHWVLAAVGALTWVLITAFAKRSGGDENIRFRIIGVLAGGLFPFLAMALVFPRFYLGPFADYDAAVLDWLFRLIKETTPLVPTSREGVGLFLSELGPVLIAVTYALYRLWRGDQTERQLMALLLLGFVLFVPLTMAVSRWAVYAQALAWLPWTLAALALFDADPSAVIVGRRIPLRAPLVGIFITAPLALALAVTPLVPSLTVTQQSPGRTSVGPQCDWFGMATHLSQRHATAGGGE